MRLEGAQVAAGSHSGISTVFLGGVDDLRAFHLKRAHRVVLWLSEHERKVTLATPFMLGARGCFASGPSSATIPWHQSRQGSGRFMEIPVRLAVASAFTPARPIKAR